MKEIIPYTVRDLYEVVSDLMIQGYEDIPILIGSAKEAENELQLGKFTSWALADISDAELEEDEDEIDETVARNSEEDATVLIISDHPFLQHVLVDENRKFHYLQDPNLEEEYLEYQEEERQWEEEDAEEDEFDDEFFDEDDDNMIKE